MGVVGASVPLARTRSVVRCRLSDVLVGVDRVRRPRNVRNPASLVSLSADFVFAKNDRPELLAFYQSNGFKSWTTRDDAKDKVCYDQMFAVI